MSRTDEIRARCNAATGTAWIRINGQIFLQLGTRDMLKIGGGFDIRDAEFVAHAREDIPWLLAENARLEAERDAAIADINSLRGRSCPCHICEFVDMIRCCHHDHCGEKHEFFKRRGAQPATGAGEERGR